MKDVKAKFGGVVALEMLWDVELIGTQLIVEFPLKGQKHLIVMHLQWSKETDPLSHHGAKR
jgi:hypothetical protein